MRRAVGNRGRLLLAGFKGLVLCAGFVERLENSLPLLEIVVHEVDEEECLHHLRDQLAWRRARLVVLGPL